MREILFRGQTRRFGERLKNFKGDPMPSNWVYGGVCCGKGAFSIIYDYMDEEKEKPIEKHVVYTDTIGQYTGLTDKNGKKIFEGDIVDCWSEGVNAKGMVKRRKDGMWIMYPAWQNEILWKLCPDDYGKTTVEVIGNVFDNPELLKGE